MALDLAADITRLRGAEYNPRKITDADMEALRASIRELGVVKPLIARGDLLVAGHQRTRALLAEGITTAPVYLLGRDTTTYDEIRFNQLHNGTEQDCGEENASIEGGFDALGWQVADGSRIKGNHRSKLAVVRAEIAGLINTYGSWGGVVATQSGRVIHCAQYALAAALIRAPLTCYVVADEDAERYAMRLNKTYGQFSYDHLPKATYIQSLAQMYRLRDTGSGRQQKSELYERYVMPWLAKNPKARVLDFGAGQGDYAKKLRGQGYNVHDVELFRRVGGSTRLDVGAINAAINHMISDMEEHGRYDVVVCDSVLNSIDSKQAEGAVVATCNALCKAGGLVFFAGRTQEEFRTMANRTRYTGRAVRVFFPDSEGLVALYRGGQWFYQMYHTREQIDRLIAEGGLTSVLHQFPRNKDLALWKEPCIKTGELTREAAEAAIRFEFDLPLSETRRLGRAEDVWRILEKYY